MTRSGFLAGVAFAGLLALSGCGYRLSGSDVDAGEGRTLAVPVFVNQTMDFRIEQRLTAAVRRELIRRTRYDVTSRPSGDVLLTGEVLTITTIPVIFTEEGRGTAYTVAVDIGVRLTETDSGRILFDNPRWMFREVFELSNDSEAFVPEDTAAMDRLARNFSEALVAALFEAERPR